MDNFKNNFQNKVTNLKELITATKKLANDISYIAYDIDKCAMDDSKDALTDVLEQKIQELALANLKVQKVIMLMLPEDDAEDDAEVDYDKFEEYCSVEDY